MKQEPPIPLGSNTPTPPRYCHKCGEMIPDTQMDVTCRACLHSHYMVTMLEREREFWEGRTFADVHLSHGRNRLRHVVLKHEPSLTYCGQRATENKRMRQRVKPHELPEGICTDCVKIYRQVHKLATQASRN